MNSVELEFLFNLSTGDLIFDIETYPNAFTIGIEHADTRQRWYFEISPRRNDLTQFCLFIEQSQIKGNRWVGYNNIGFDYPVIHFIYQNRDAFIGVDDIYNKAMSIINSHGPGRFAHMVWESDWLIPQIDLYKIHHFDNMAKATSLKMLEFNMRMDNIEDLPFPVGTVLTDDQIQTLADYMWHDITATKMFYDKTLKQIEFREKLSLKYDKNFINYNDTKIGSEIFIYELEQSGIECYERVNNKKQPRQSPRTEIKLKDAILPWIQFQTPEFQRVLDWIKSQVITETKGVFKDVNCTLHGIQYDFGTGGLHASVSSQVIHSDDTHVIIDADVASMYPNIAISNNFYPEHLGEKFCEIYQGLYEQRKSYAKGTAENAMLKLALNGTYGNSNNQYSPFYDPLYTMKTTLNGQLLLCLLIEWMFQVPGLKIISANTDGVCALVPRQYESYYYEVCKHWDKHTGLTLEYDKYKMMAISDVNNYIAVAYDEEEN